MMKKSRYISSICSTSKIKWQTSVICRDGREAVFKGTKNGFVPMKDPEYIATYNYVSPYVPRDGKIDSPKDYYMTVSRGIGHFSCDMLPYYMMGYSNTRL